MPAQDAAEKNLLNPNVSDSQSNTSSQYSSKPNLTQADLLATIGLLEDS